MIPWTPTSYLRFIERHGKRLLQQKWELRDDNGVLDTEWRDIPLMPETP